MTQQPDIQHSRGMTSSSSTHQHQHARSQRRSLVQRRGELLQPPQITAPFNSNNFPTRTKSLKRPYQNMASTNGKESLPYLRVSLRSSAKPAGTNGSIQAFVKWSFRERKMRSCCIWQNCFLHNGEVSRRWYVSSCFSLSFLVIFSFLLTLSPLLFFNRIYYV